jgi:hypothetical protein
MANYATIAEVKAQINKTQADDDAVLTAMITAASLAIDNFCNRLDGFEAVDPATARTYAGDGKAWHEMDDAAAVTLVEVKDSMTDASYTSWAATDWLAFTGDPERPNFNRLPYTAIMVAVNGEYAAFLNGKLGAISQPTVRITAQWGYALTVPDPIKQATITQVARWYKRGESGWSDVLASGELGQLFYQKMIDPAVKFILVGGRYVRPVV